MTAAMAGPVLGALATWVLTYWVHGTIAAAAALAAGRWLLRAPAARDPLWKAALVVPLVSATLATAAPHPAAVPPVRLGHRVRALLPGVGGPTEVRRVVVVTEGRRREWVIVRDPLAAAASGVVLLLAALGGGVGLMGVARRWRALAHAVRGRRRVAPDAAPHELAPGVVLSESAALAAPVALGGGGRAREVCVPPSFWALTPRQRRGVLVHECAHLERRDPLWIGVAELLAAASAQPLARLVVERLRRDAEFICDEAAVRRTRDARALVESLAALARPFDPAAGPAPLVPGYLDSPLAQRAVRVLGVDLTRGAPARARRAAGWAAIAALSLGLSAAPAFTTGVAVDPRAVLALRAGAPGGAPGGARRFRVVRIGTRVVPPPPQRAAPPR